LECEQESESKTLKCVGAESEYIQPKRAYGNRG